MLKVQYPMQFSEPLGIISNHIHHRFAHVNSGSTQLGFNH